jgi:hypothetical protein
MNADVIVVGAGLAFRTSLTPVPEAVEHAGARRGRGLREDLDYDFARLALAA